MLEPCRPISRSFSLRQTERRESTGVQVGRRPLGTSYWQLWTATVISALGDGVALVAFPLLAAGLTRRPLLIAGVAMAQRLPWLLLSLPAGALADRVDRRRLMSGIDGF